MALGFAPACREPKASGVAGSVTIVAPTTPGAGLDVSGVSNRVLRRLQRLSPNDTLWTSLVAVYVDRGLADSATARRSAASVTPPVIGRYAVDAGRIHFVPRFPFAPGVSYIVRVDTASLTRIAIGESAGGLTLTRPLTERFSLAAAASARMTRVVAVHPSASHVPSNLLRWYIDFSAPMEPGTALSHVRLLDEAGREVRGAFLALDQELWDPDRRRLTLLFDPGRVKRGVRANDEMGAPLVAGRRYRLVIDNEWPDGTGAALMSGFEHAFEAMAADRQALDVARWRLTIPAAGSRAALGVAFGEILDHALANRLLSVADASGRPVPGTVSLGDDDSVWKFVPERPWVAGEHGLRVATTLEDVAGNSLARPFDVDRMKPNAVAPAAGVDSVRVVRFRVAP